MYEVGAAICQDTLGGHPLVERFNSSVQLSTRVGVYDDPRATSRAR
jgi:hypothetical protein